MRFTCLPQKSFQIFFEAAILCISKLALIFTICNNKVFHIDLRPFNVHSSKAAYVTYKVYMFFFSLVYLFPWNRTHDLQNARNKLYCLSNRNAVAVSEVTLVPVVGNRRPAGQNKSARSHIILIAAGSEIYVYFSYSCDGSFLNL